MSAIFIVHMRVYVCLDQPAHAPVGDHEGLLPECSVSYITWSDDLSSWGEPE